MHSPARTSPQLDCIDSLMIIQLCGEGFKAEDEEVFLTSMTLAQSREALMEHWMWGCAAQQGADSFSYADRTHEADCEKQNTRQLTCH